MYSKAITCCKLEEAKIYRETLAKRFYCILTDPVALIDEDRADMLSMAGLRMPQFELGCYSVVQATVQYILTSCTFSPQAKA